MALAHLDYFSPALRKMSKMIVVIPDRTEFPMVYLLHGLSDDHSAWQRRSTVELFADRLGIGLAMLDGARSFYTDQADGTADYAQHILDSVGIVERTFRAIPERGARAIQGLSMGGYGAMKLGLRHGDRFCSIWSHSGALDMAAPADATVRHKESRHMRALFGDGAFPADEDTFALAKRLKRAKSPRPAIGFDCGVDDVLLAENRRFHLHLDSLGIAHTYREHPGGHSWDYWQAHVNEGLVFHCEAFAAHGTWSDVKKPKPKSRRSP